MKYSTFANGIWLEGNGETFHSLNPVTEEILWTGKEALVNEVDNAVLAARNAFNTWRALSYSERLAHVQKFRAALEDHQDLLANTIGQETGKPLWEARTEVTAMLGKIAISDQAYKERTGVTEKDTAVGKSTLRHRPHGVIAVFGPYNFPGHLPNGHIVPALLAGNTAVLKPSELTPLTAVKMVELWHQSGLPEGVLNLVLGGQKTGVALASHAQIDGLFFTGSSATGLSLYSQFSGNPEKILALEMGGNNPLIVEPLENVTAALHHVLFSAFISAGQRCTCARRLLVKEGKWGDNFIQKLIQGAAQLSVNRYDVEEQPFMGALISLAAAEQLLDKQQELVDLGAKILLESKYVQLGTPLISPGILDVTDVADVPDEEIFGPLLQVFRYRDLDHAIELGNATRYGLAAGILSDDEAKFDYFNDRIRAGIVNWNKPLTGASSSAPFGGVGLSGNYRPSAYYAADYCAYPVASLTDAKLDNPANLPPGMKL